MTDIKGQVAAVEVPAGGALDAIMVYFRNVGPCKGYVTIVCYGQAWSSYFGAMPTETVQEFFAKADTAYLARRLSSGEFLKQSKRHEAYLERIVKAVKAVLPAVWACVKGSQNSPAPAPEKG